MIFDKSKVYTAVSADELEKGDLVVFASCLSNLKLAVENDFIKELNGILPENEQCRFVTYDGITYAFAYLVCRKENVKAYKAFQEGKLIEKAILSLDENGEWQDAWKVTDKPDFINNTLRVAQEREKYRPFSTNQELLDTWASKIKRQVGNLFMPLIWVREKEENTVSMINAFIEDNVVSIAAGDIIELDELYKQYTFLDGSPCGIEQ